MMTDSAGAAQGIDAVWPWCVFVCVKHLNRCKARALFSIELTFAGGRSVMVSLLPKKTLIMAVIPDLASLAYLHSCDHLLFRVCFHPNSNFILQSVRVNGNRLSPEPEQRSLFRTFAAIWYYILFHHGCGVGSFSSLEVGSSGATQDSGEFS